MSDIVERLREDAPSLGMESHDPTYDDRQEAADEIERLERMVKHLMKVQEQAEQASVEIRRLRAALRKICDTYMSGESDYTEAALMYQAAREALEQ